MPTLAKLFAYSVFLFSLSAHSQITTIDYPSSSLSTSACNVFNPAVDVNNITHQSHAGGVAFDSTNGIILSTIPSGQGAGGTAYVIQYNFTTGSNYTISITAIGNNSLYLKTAVVPNLNQFNTASTTSCTPDPNVTAYSTVGGEHIYNYFINEYCI